MRYLALKRTGRVLLAGLLLLAAAAPRCGAAEGKDLVVFAAASLKNALDEAGTAFARESGRKPAISYAASSALARQIEAGAPADIFISADRDWMDYLAQKGLIKPQTRSDLLGNSLVLIAAAATGADVAIGPHFPLAALLGDGRLALADPDSVPAGKYAKAALQSLDVWAGVAGKLAPAENVRAAALLVARGEAPFGIVYRTDAAAEPGVKIVGTFPEATHPAIVYPIAVTARSTDPAAPAFLAFLRSAAARTAFTRQGFTLLE
ncbi:MAG: molybdate ABC transporter substrate-binding protein [Alphaproteobacteria bacterium]|nr:molybdate ABC transporter substrate-binding protein [Alphaproteobacteria bacterium]